MSARRSVSTLPLSGPEIQTILELFLHHIDRCIQARFESYRKAYQETKRDPPDSELNEILESVRDTRELLIKQVAQALQ